MALSADEPNWINHSNGSIVWPLEIELGFAGGLDGQLGTVAAEPL
jgi:hypothetical protein